MGRTIPSWRMVAEAETAKLKKFQGVLSQDEKVAFNDMLLACKIFAPYAGAMASPVKELPILISILFAQHKRIMEIEKKIQKLETAIEKKREEQLDVQSSTAPLSLPAS